MNPRRILRRLVGIDSTPERTAAAFAVGVFIGFSPLLGFHTVLGLAVAFLFRFNRLAILVGVYSNTPWFIVPYYTLATWLGFRLFGMPSGTILPDWGTAGLLDASFWWALAREWRLLIPPAIGSLLLSTVLALASYPAALTLIRRIRALKETRRVTRFDGKAPASSAPVP